MYEFAQYIHSECSHDKLAVLVICVDHRNHGERLVDPDQNEGWEEGGYCLTLGNITFAMGLAYVLN
jgi:hypothetical protein